MASTAKLNAACQCLGPIKASLLFSPERGKIRSPGADVPRCHSASMVPHQGYHSDLLTNLPACDLCPSLVQSLHSGYVISPIMSPLYSRTLPWLTSHRVRQSPRCCPTLFCIIQTHVNSLTSSPTQSAPDILTFLLFHEQAHACLRSFAHAVASA